MNSFVSSSTDFCLNFFDENWEGKIIQFYVERYIVLIGLFMRLFCSIFIFENNFVSVQNRSSQRWAIVIWKVTLTNDLGV